MHQNRSRFLHFLHALLTLQLDAERSCHRLLRWLKRAALRSKSRSKQRHKILSDARASSSPSKSPMHYTHTDGGVSAIRCLDQSVDEPPDSPARAPPSRCHRGSYQSLCCQNFRSPRSSQSWQNSQQPRTFEHRLLLFLLTERGLNEDFLTSVLRALRNSRLLCPRCSGSTSRIIGCRSPPSEV